MTSYTSQGGEGSSPGSSTPSTPSHAQWLRRQFSGGGEGVARRDSESLEAPWPDLLVDRRTLQERRQGRVGSDPGALERSNLVAILQLVVKSVVDASLRFGRQLDQENTSLHQLFVVLELCLRHGLRTRRVSLLQGRRELWDLLQTVGRSEQGAEEITLTARDLGIVKTGAGRARAWLRLAVMQKKLGDYIKALVDKREVMAEFYEPEALLVSDEGVLLCGLLVSLNIVDCNLCLKEEDLDNQEGVIDLSHYLRRKEDIGRDDTALQEEVEEKDITTVMDQKNYIEEMNRNLAASVTNLQARVETVTTTNALMREDLAISKRRVAALEEERAFLEGELGRQTQLAEQARAKEEVEKYQSLDPGPVSEAKAEADKEKRARQELEKELGLEEVMKAEMEMAMKLLEKDVHEKQDTIVTLRAQLEDIKTINLEMFTKLAECQKSLTYKSELIQKLEGKSMAMADTLQQLDAKFVESEKSCQAVKASNASLKQEAAEAVGRTGEVAADLRIEREWRERLQETCVRDREGMEVAKREVDFLRQVGQEYDNLRQANDKLREQAKESELTLEELGQQLSWSKLQVDSMREEVLPAGSWEKDSEAASCKICDREFSLARRKHHCRNCGGIFCDGCSDNKMKLPSSSKPIRVCDSCYTLLINKQSKVM